METRSRGRIDDIEALRAFAILLVFFHHLRSDLTWWSSPLKETTRQFANGGTGVGLFLVISGYVIGRSLFPVLDRARDEGNYWNETLAFWLRRFWRLIPSAWLWLSIPLVLSAVFNDSGAFGTPKGNTLASAAALFQVANYHIGTLMMNPDPSLTNSVFVYWSLSLEEQFYLLLPLLAFLARKRLAWVLTALVILQLWVPGIPIMHFFRTQELFLGLLLAYAHDKGALERFEPRWLRHAPLRSLFVLSCLGGLVFFASPASPFEIRHLSTPFFSTLLVWAALYDRGYIVASDRIRACLRWMGSRSYGVYLIHVPAFFFVREVFHRMDPRLPVDWRGEFSIGLFLVCGIVLPWLLADLNFKKLEAPMRQHGRIVAKQFLARRRVVNGGEKCNNDHEPSCPGLVRPS